MKVEPTFQDEVSHVLNALESMLVAKNRAYGNAALEPSRIFSKADPIEQIKVRIDDKLSRLAKGNGYGNEDTVFDLMGYLILLRIAIKRDALKGPGVQGPDGNKGPTFTPGIGPTIDDAFGAQMTASNRRDEVLANRVGS